MGRLAAARLRFSSSNICTASNAASIARLQALAPFPSFKREGRKHGVADELEHLAPSFPQRRGQSLEDVIEEVNDNGTGKGVADRGEAADVRVPDDGAERLRRSPRHGAGMDAATCILAKVSPQQTGGDDMARVRFHRQRKRRQSCLEEREVVVAEAAFPVGREGIDDPGSLRTVACLAVGKEIRRVVRAPDAEEFLQYRKIALFRSRFEPASQRRTLLATLRLLDQRVERAPDPHRRVEVAVRVLLRRDGVEVAPPGISRIRSIAGATSPSRYARARAAFHRRPGAGRSRRTIRRPCAPRSPASTAQTCVSMMRRPSASSNVVR